MSKYGLNHTELKDQSLVKKAFKQLSEQLGIVVEFHEQPQNLYGYHGDKRAEKANIIIRRPKTQTDANTKVLSTASNDFGLVWNEQTASYDAIVSDFDSSRYGPNILRQVKTAYAQQFMARLSRQVGGTHEPEVKQTKGGVKGRILLNT
jgi:hypothetical protein